MFNLEKRQLIQCRETSVISFLLVFQCAPEKREKKMVVGTWDGMECNYQPSWLAGQLIKV
jgi:hypothetical protein